MNDKKQQQQQQLMTDILTRLVKLDFVHLAILSVNLSEHQFNVLQQSEINRLRSSKEDQPLTDKKKAIN